jgi:hypothetical protein
MQHRRWQDELISITFVDDPDLVMVLLAEKQPEALRFLAKAPLGEGIAKEHKFRHFSG